MNEGHHQDWPIAVRRVKAPRNHRAEQAMHPFYRHIPLLRRPFYQRDRAMLERDEARAIGDRLEH